jgi:hypothetical protein
MKIVGRRSLVRGTWALALVTLATLSCTDTTLYSPSHVRAQADRVTLSGRVCTEDPAQSNFPMRIILLVDRAAGPLFSDYDPGGQRLNVLRDFIQTNGANRAFQFAVIGYAGQPEKLAPLQGNFTRNPGELNNALTQLSTPRGCSTDEQCRDQRRALSLARSLIEGDLATQPPGLRGLTQYVIINLNAGPQAPMADGSQCCSPADLACQETQAGPSPACEAQLVGDEVAQIRELVTSMGGAGLRLHGIHLAAEPEGNDVPEAQRRVNGEVQTIMEQMVFAGRGEYQRFNDIGGLNYNSLNLLGLRIVLHAKVFMAANLNARPTAQGPRVDSDRDGLTDEEELRLGTSPTDPDTDGDGITDLVEILTGLDPLQPDEIRTCARYPVGSDMTFDGLTDCDNLLLGTEPSLMDTDGDGIPDVLEVHAGTDYLNRDAHLDADGDGVSNGDEIVQRTDPRSIDTALHLDHGYRYEIEDEGFVTELFASVPRRLTGVRIREMSPGTSASVGALRFDAGAQTLRWRDGNDTDFGPAVALGSGGRLELVSSSYAPIQGDDGRRIWVDVDVIDLPPTDTTESIRIVRRTRQCLAYTVRNVRLMPTLELDDGTPAGRNHILLYLGQAPEGRMDVPGPYRIALIPVDFDPPNRRYPADAILYVEDDEFIRPPLTVLPRLEDP